MRHDHQEVPYFDRHWVISRTLPQPAVLPRALSAKPLLTSHFSLSTTRCYCCETTLL
ncbi:hypothetical protein (plasmid) [Erwinia amylovora ATCC 49946]|nr:hypothetical protein [Erwinia amylovora ATCC 49946]